MSPIKAEPIDSGLRYPCPRCRHGKLCPITLTDAFGCQKCQKIFVLQSDGYTIEQLSASPVSQVWRWDGQDWRPVRSRWPAHLIVLMCLGGAALLLLAGLLVTASLSVRSKVLWWIVIAIIVACTALLLSLRYRRH